MIRKRQNHVRIENYFERIKPLSDFWSHFRISRTTVSRLEHLLPTCPGLPHGQRNGGRHTIDLQKQVLITIWILGNPECLRSVDLLNGFARKERHRSEILIQIIPKERTISLKTLFLFLSFQWHWLSWRTRLWGSRRGDGFLRLTVEILAILRLTLHFLPL